MRAFEEPGASGLDIAFRCPECGPRSRLVETNNALGESRCLVCAGSHLPSYGLDQVLRETNGLTRRALQAAPPTEDRGQTPCPACQGPTDRVPLRNANADFCRRCGSAWFEGNALFAATAGRFGVRTNLAPMFELRPPRAAARRAPPVLAARRRRLPLIVVAGIAGAILGTAGFLVAPSLREEFAATPTSPAAGLAAPGDPGGLAALPAPPSSGEGIRDYPFAGRTATWWGERLTALKAETGERAEARYALTKARAIANGLSIDDSGAQVRVEPSAALLAEIGRRLEKK